MKTLSALLSDYRSQNKAVPAFNIDCFAIYQAVESAVQKTLLPCIVQLSSGEDKFVGAKRLLMLVKKAQLDGLPIYLNYDHGHDLSYLEQLVRLGFDMVHFDGSSLAYDENLSKSQLFIDNLKQINPSCLVEVEFNKIEMAGSQVSSDSFTIPSQAKEFLLESNADLLAVSVGNLHGVDLKLPETINLDLLSQISQKIPSGKYLTLHGGSGISPQQINLALSQGIVKININTDLRLVFKNSLIRSLDSSDSVKVYQYLEPVVADLETVIIQKLNQFHQTSSSPSV